MKKVNVVVVGVGGHGYWLLKSIKSCNNFFLSACCDTDETRVKKVSKEFNCIPYTSLSDMLSIPEIQGVIISVPNHLHAKCVVASAKADKHCFVEKPIANTIEDAKKMINICKKNKVILAVGHNMRRRAEFRKAYEIIRKGILGEVISCEANFSRPGALALPTNDWRRSNNTCPMPAIMQLGIHAIDALLYLIGPVKRVKAFELSHGNNVSAVLEFKSKTLGYVGSNYFSKEYWFTNIYGKKANLYLSNNSLVLETDKSAPQRIKLAPVDTLKEEIYEFGEAIKRETKVEIDGITALESLKIVRAMIKSSGAEASWRQRRHAENKTVIN